MATKHNWFQVYAQHATMTPEDFVQPLSGLDASFLALDTPTAPMHVATAVVLDPKSAPQDLTFDRIRDIVQNRLRLLPAWRKRLVEVPFGLHHPVWVEDPNFNLDFHVRRAALPAPGGMTELSEFCADLLSHPLDRSRPLWDFVVVEGLQNGYIAVVSKNHHALIDGVSGAEMIVAFMDLEPEPRWFDEEDPWKPEVVPSELDMLKWASGEMIRQPAKAVRAARNTLEIALDLRKRNREVDVMPPPAPFSAPRTSFNRKITAHRSIAFDDISLDDMKLIKNTFGGKVNDVVLAASAGAFRRYLLDKGETPDSSLVAMCPISVHDDSNSARLGNKISSMLVNLGTDISDPLERYRAIQQYSAASKEQASAIGADLLQDWAQFATSAVFGSAVRLYSRYKVANRMRPLYNVTISNVPGPDFSLYAGGARMVGFYPMGPVVDGLGVNLTVASYSGRMHIGLVACKEVMPDPQRLVDGFAASVAELVKLAQS